MSARSRVWCWCSGFPTVGYVSFLAYHQPWTYSISQTEHLYRRLKILQQKSLKPVTHIHKKETQKKTHTYTYTKCLELKNSFQATLQKWPWVVKMVPLFLEKSGPQKTCPKNTSRFGRSLRDLLELPLPEMEVRQTSREGMGQWVKHHIGAWRWTRNFFTELWMVKQKKYDSLTCP